MGLYIGCCVPKKVQAEKLNLPTYVILKDVPNKKMAAIIIAGEFFQTYPEIAECYFNVKILEATPGTDRPALNEWSTDFELKEETNTVEFMATNKDVEPELPSEELKSVNDMPINFRGAVLSLFGPVERITNAEYSRVIDLVNDDVPSTEREIAEAISRTTRFFALYPERQTELLTAMRENVRHGAQWTDYKKFLDKRLDAPTDKRDAPLVDAEGQKTADEKLHTPSGATVGDQNQTDRGVGFVMNNDVLAMEVALGIVGRTMDFDIYNLSSSVVNRARDIINDKEKPFPSWFDAVRAAPGILDYSRASIIYVVKCAPENQPLAPGALIEYLNRTLTETDHEHPSQDIIDAACGIKSTEENNNATEQDEQSNAGIVDNGHTENNNPEQVTSGVSESTQEVKPGRTVFSLEELEAGPDVEPPARPEMSEREIEIIIAINDAMCGAGNIMSVADAVEMLTVIGLPTHEVVAVLACDFATVDKQLHFAIADDEIYHLTLDLLDDWNENPEQRLELIRIGVEEWRQWEKEQTAQRCKNADPSTNELVQKVESVNQSGYQSESCAIPSPLTYHQQLTIAALTGLCANPAHATSHDDLPGMASWLADSVISVQEREHG